MKRQTEPLSEHTWLKIGGPAEIVIPETKTELIELLKECANRGRSYRLLGNGSNLLVSDGGIDDLVIKHTEACTEVTVQDDLVHVGASVAVPQFVNICTQHDLGGYEYLYSVPGTIGGAIYMNAGRGKSHNMTISDYLVNVEIFSGEDIRILDIEDLEFAHRYSTFQEHKEWTILSATFDLPSQPQKKGQRRIQERMQKVDKRERSKPTAGSVFKSGSRIPLHKIPPNGLKVGDAHFVESNRIVNNGNATYRDVVTLITRAQWLHKLVPWFDVPELEYVIWE